MEDIYKDLGTTQEDLIEDICRLNGSGGVVATEHFIGNDYIYQIAENIVDDVAEDISAAADLDNWNDDDIRLAVGRVLCDRLGIEL